MTERPGATLPPADFSAAAAELEAKIGRPASSREVVSYLLYSRVFLDFVTHDQTYEDTSVLPTAMFLYGQEVGEEVAVDIEPGKTLIIRLLTISDPHSDGSRTVYFELNGQPRAVTVVDRSLEPETPKRPLADPADPKQIASPMPGMVVLVAVKPGDKVKKGQKLLTLEAMKMETTLYAETAGTIATLLASPGTQVETGELLVRLE